MLLEINGKEKELRFDIGFIRQLDELYKADANGLSFGMGLQMATIQLQSYNPTALSDVVRCAVKGKPRLQEIDDAIYNYAEENRDLEGLFEEVIEELGKSPVVKATLKRMKQMSDQD